MNWNELFYAVITCGAIPVIAGCLITLVKTKVKESKFLEEKINNEKVSNMIKDAICNVMDAVLFVNQTYTDSIKAKGKFNKDAQAEAFDKAYLLAMDLISAEVKDSINNLHISFDTWLRTQIEACVNKAKETKKV